MQPIGDVIKKIVKERNLGDQTNLQKDVLQSPEVREFLQKNKNKIDMSMVKNSMSNLYEFYIQLQNPDKIMSGYRPELFLNGDVIDVRYTPTAAKIEADREKTIEHHLELIDLPERLHNVRLSQIDIDEGRKEVLSLIGEFLSKYKKNPHQQGLYLSGDFGRGKTYILAGLANQVAKENKNIVFLHVPTFIASLSSHFEDNSLQQEIRRVADADLLILDDIGAESLSQWSRDDVLGVILQARMDNVLPTFFSSNLDMNDLEEHFAETKNSVDKVKAARIMQRIRFLSKEVVVFGPNRRKI